MGLDFSHCGARWGYGGFLQFRSRLAEAIGISNYNSMSTMEEVHDAFTEMKLTEDPIETLLVHSDCDGCIRHYETEALAKRIREMIVEWDDSDYDKINALELAEGLELAHQQKEDLEFK